MVGLVRSTERLSVIRPGIRDLSDLYDLWELENIWCIYFKDGETTGP